MFCLCESYSKSLEKVIENFLIVTDVYIFMLNYNALRDAAGDKEFTIVIQMTLEHILVQRSKKIENEKSNF